MASRLRAPLTAFVIPDVVSITAEVFALKHNTNAVPAENAVKEEFMGLLYESDRDFLLKLFNRGKCGSFASMTFPEIDSRKLETCMISIFCALLIDDLADEGGLEARPEELREALDRLISIFSPNQDAATIEPRTPIERLFSLFSKRLTVDASVLSQQRITSAFKDWCQALVQQSVARKADVLPSMEEFIPFRRVTSGIRMVEGIVAFATGIDLPSEILQDHQVVLLLDAANDVISWVNDLASFKKEHDRNDYHNLVLCLMNERNASVQSAVDETTAMLRQRVQEYSATKESLLGHPDDVLAVVKQYFAALESFVQGMVVWHMLAVTRYQ